MATGKEWRDDCGQSLAWLDWAGQTEQAAAVRARHAFTSTAASRQDSPADECAPAQAVGATRAQIASRVNDMQEGAGGLELHTGIEEHVGQLALAFGDSGSPAGSVADAEPDSPTSAAMTDDLRASREAWTGDLVGQALQMSYDTHTRQMCVPRDGQRVYNGYVRSRIASRKARTSDSLYVCWFEDHSTEEVSESLLRQCVTTADIETRTVVQSMTPEAVCVVAACRHVWGQDTMPPCVRDASDGVSRSCALLVFDYKTVYVNQYQVTDIIDDRASSVVEFLLNPRNEGHAMCSTCASETDRRQWVMATYTTGTAPISSCRHVLAVRHIWRTLHHRMHASDLEVDTQIATSTVRCRGNPCSPARDSDAEQSAAASTTLHQDDAEPQICHFPYVLPSTGTCHFLVAQVRSPTPCRVVSSLYQ